MLCACKIHTSRLKTVQPLLYQVKIHTAPLLSTKRQNYAGEEEEQCSLVHYVMHSPLPEPVPLEDEGALLQGHSLGLHKEEAHKYGHADHTYGKEQEGCPLQQNVSFRSSSVPFRSHTITLWPPEEDAGHQVQQAG